MTASTTRLDPTTYLDHLRTESARFRAVLADCDPAARVPTCPDWDAADLLWHLAEVQLFWAKVVRHRPAAPDDPEIAEEPKAERPESYVELLEAFDDYSHALVTELERADPEAEAWHWSDDNRVATSYRRQAHEALIHRVDAELAAGVPVTPLDTALAADGVAETVEIMFGGDPPPWGRIERGTGVVDLELPDAGAAIYVEPCTFFGTDPESGKNYDGPHVLVVPEPGRPADVVVRGDAADVDLWLWRRGDQAGIEVSGDQTVYAAFRAAVDQPID